MLKDFMVEQYAAGKKMLLVIDEAQNLSRKVLEEVRLLSGLEAAEGKAAAHHHRGSAGAVA